MADTPSRRPEHSGSTRESEHDAIRSSNDRDQEAEREGTDTEHNRGYDDAARGLTSEDDEDSEEIDPDSAESDNDRDDTLDD